MGSVRKALEREVQVRPLEGKCKEGIRKGSVKKALGREVYGRL